jgi:hypothetical protein
MSERSPAPSARPSAPDAGRQTPPPDVVEFIRFCHRRRHVGWPDLYDEMCAVAARREFNGWGLEQLAEHDLTFSLYDMPRLAGWVRLVLGPQGNLPDADHRAIVQPASGAA